MRNRHSEADPGAQHRLSLLHRRKDFRIAPTRLIDEVPSQLGDHPALVAGGQGYQYPVRREQLCQKHGVARVGMASNLYRALRRGNALLELMLGLFATVISYGDGLWAKPVT